MSRRLDPTAAARAALDAAWDRSIPVCPYGIARNLGIEVRDHRFTDDSISQIVQDADTGRHVILLDEHSDEQRRRWAVSHSLGHLLSGHVADFSVGQALAIAMRNKVRSRP